MSKRKDQQNSSSPGPSADSLATSAKRARDARSSSSSSVSAVAVDLSSEVCESSSSVSGHVESRESGVSVSLGPLSVESAVSAGLLCSSSGEALREVPSEGSVVTLGGEWVVHFESGSGSLLLTRTRRTDNRAERTESAWSHHAHELQQRRSEVVALSGEITRLNGVVELVRCVSSTHTESR